VEVDDEIRRSLIGGKCCGCPSSLHTRAAKGLISAF